MIYFLLLFLLLLCYDTTKEYGGRVSYETNSKRKTRKGKACSEAGEHRCGDPTGAAVGNSAVQEAVAGKRYYNCDKIIVITNNYFTTSAITLAKVNNVILWDREILKDKINEYLNK